MSIRSAFPLLLVPVVAVVITITQLSSAAVIAEKTPVASGEGQFTFNGEQIDFAFEATTNKIGHAKGRAEFDNLAAQTHVEVKIDCLSAGGSVAVMTGTVLHTDDPDYPKSAQVIFAAFDGPGWAATPQDDITPLFVVPFPGGVDCHETAPLTILPLNSGDIRVQP